MGMMVAAQRGPGCYRLSVVDSQRPRPVQCSPMSASWPWPECVSQAPGIVDCPLLFTSFPAKRAWQTEAACLRSQCVSLLRNCPTLIGYVPSPDDLSAEPGQEEWRLLLGHTVPLERHPVHAALQYWLGQGKWTGTVTRRVL